MFNSVSQNYNFVKRQINNSIIQTKQDARLKNNSHKSIKMAREELYADIYTYICINNN